VFVDERDAGLIRRGGGLVTMGSNADGGVGDPRRSLEDFAAELGFFDMDPVDADLCGRLWTACAGRARFAESVLRAAADAGVTVDPDSASFSDWVVGLCPRVSLSLGPGDEAAAAVLAQLSAVTETTALQALTAVADDLLGGLGISDPEGVIDRLRSSGVVTVVEDEVRGTLLKVPTLLAAKLRRDLDSAAGPVVASLLDVLVEHMESTGTLEAELLGDVLLLARSGGHWAQLLRIAEAVGIPMFLLAPRSSCTAFRLLPPRARAAGPGLEFFGTLAEDIASGADGCGADGIRAAAVAQTGPGLLRSRLPGAGAGIDSVDSIADVVGRWEQRGESLIAIRSMIGLADAGRHVEAASVGMTAAPMVRSVRARSVIRLLTAIALHHAAEHRRALSILNEIEGPARSGHVAGDFLLPAIMAWTALISAVSGDHERADAHLSAIAESSASASAAEPNTIVDELVRPARCIASALRALDRLDLDRAELALEALAAYPEKRTLWVYLPFIARTIAILSAEGESGLLFVNDDAERFRASGVLSEAERDLLARGRSMVFIALGQLRWAEIERERLSSSCDARIVLDVRSKLIAGRSAEAISCADTWFYHRSLSPHGRAELVAIRAAAHLRSGDADAARTDFSMAVSLSAWVSSLLPLALLPQADRHRLIDLIADSPVWAEATAEFSRSFDSPAALIAGLRSIGPVSVDVAAMPQLSAGEAQLIDCLARGLSVAEIAVELQQVTGTVKNRLSALYRRFGVSNRADALSRARSFGYLSGS
jgi:DNA-binding CsgD family transcriptional regulator